MSDSDLQQNRSVSGQTDDTNAVIPASSGETYEVDLWWVKDVKPGDAKQAEATMKALLNAGLKPRLVAAALERGHGYEIETMATKQKFSNISPSTMGELAASEGAVGAYEVVERLALTAGEKPLEEMVQEEGLIKAEVVTDLEIKRQQENPQKIEMTVVVKREPPKQLADSAGDFVRIEDWKSLEDKKAA